VSVGRDLSEAIFAPPHNTIRFAEEFIAALGAPVPVGDGAAPTSTLGTP
jgi:hypothetical protein